MNDHHLDPPDPDPDSPECCGEPMRNSILGWRCDDCRKVIRHAKEDIEPMENEPSDAEIAAWFTANPEPVSDKCPHGKEWGECGACDHAGDLAYDAAREGHR